MEDDSSYHKYIPTCLAKTQFKLKELLSIVKLKVVSASSQILQYQIQVDGTVLNLAQQDTKTHKITFSYPYEHLFDDEDKKFLLFYAYENKFFKIISHRQPKINKIKQDSGSEAQIQGSLFEEHCSLILNKNNDFRNNFVVKILQDLNLDPKTNQVSFVHQGAESVKNIDGSKILPKADILIQITNLITKERFNRGISAKKTNLATQVHICSVDGLKNILNLKYNIVMPILVEQGLKKFVGADGYSPQENLKPLEVKKLGQGDRNRFLLHELKSDEQTAIIDWFNANLAIIIKYVLGEGSVEDKLYHAQYLICNKVSYTKESDWEPVILAIEDEIAKAKDLKVSFSASGGALKLGDKLTLQMKGSGSKNQRVCLQFKKSL